MAGGIGDPGPSLDHLLEFAVDLAWRAGRLTLASFQTGIASDTKPDLSPVTEADRASERFCRERIAARFPGDGIVGEEFGIERAGARRRWILDPIDGTRSFMRGVPFYGVLIGLETRADVAPGGAPADAGYDAVLGVIHLPALDETVCAARGAGCWWNGRRARVSSVAEIRDAAVLLTDPEDPEPPGFERLRAGAALVRTWGDCYGHALVATGRAEVMVDFRAAPWDAAALLPVIEEAGGVFTDLAGRRTHRGGSALSTNAALAAEVRRAIANS